MKKIVTFIVLAIFLTSFIFAHPITGYTTEDNGDSENETEGEKVCCKIYGLGTNMVKVNIRYGWIEESECVVPEGLLGGGREIVDDAYCKDNKTIKTKILTKEQITRIIIARNRLRIQVQEGECPDECTCTGSVTKCELENGGRNMTIRAGKSGNLIVQVKEINMSTNVTLYKSEGKIFGVFKNNETREINILPDHVQEKIRERIKSKLQNQTIELDEEGIYRIQGKKKARLFFIFPVRERVRMQIDSETGQVIKVRNPWWGFLAKDIDEEEE